MDAAPADVRRTGSLPDNPGNSGTTVPDVKGNPCSRTRIRAIDQLLFQKITPLERVAMPSAQVRM